MASLAIATGRVASAVLGAVAALRAAPRRRGTPMRAAGLLGRCPLSLFAQAQAVEESAG